MISSFSNQNYVTGRGVIAVLSMCLGTMKGPCFYLGVTVISAWKNKKSYQDEEFCSKGTQYLQVYKLLDFKRQERKPFRPEVDMSFFALSLTFSKHKLRHKRHSAPNDFFTFGLVTLSSSWMTPLAHPYPLLSGRKSFNSSKLKASNVLHSDLEGLLALWYLASTD